MSKQKNEKTTISVNRQHKDRLFRFIFQNRKDLLNLYNALNHTDYQNEQELTINILEDAIYLGMKNDLSFIISATMNLYEHQSTWNANMPLRGLFYFARLYQNYLEQQGFNLYGEQRIPLPFPNYLVFYNGFPEIPDQTELCLSDAFLIPSGVNRKPCLECNATILNINQGHNQELMQSCRRLWEYAEFIETIGKNLAQGYTVEIAMEKAIDTCLAQGILSDILKHCQTEVLNMLLSEYNERETMEYLRREHEQVGEKRGFRKGSTAKLVSLIQKKVTKARSPEQIAEDLEEPLENLLPIIEWAKLHTNCPPEQYLTDTSSGKHIL